MKLGDRLKDNDPRMKTRRPLEIVEILPNSVVARNMQGRTFRILARRIHTDGKPRRSGFDLMSS